jgi:hypothetical protein
MYVYAAPSKSDVASDTLCSIGLVSKIIVHLKKESHGWSTMLIHRLPALSHSFFYVSSKIPLTTEQHLDRAKLCLRVARLYA